MEEYPIKLKGKITIGLEVKNSETIKSKKQDLKRSFVDKEEHHENESPAKHLKTVDCPGLVEDNEVPSTSQQHLMAFSSFWNLKRTQSPDLPLTCDNCDTTTAESEIIGCLNAHLICHACLKKQAKNVILNQDLNKIPCPLDGCEYQIRTEDVNGHLPDGMQELLVEKMEKVEVERLETSLGVYRCPDCGFAAIPSENSKRFSCQNKFCQKHVCMICEKDWIDSSLHENCRKLGKEFQFINIKLPSLWIENDPYANSFTRVTLSSDSLEFAQINVNVDSQAVLLSVDRVENPRLWNMYCYKKQIMKLDNDDINEMQLYHGTDYKSIPVICKEGFDNRVAKMTGAYGAGCYFATTTRISRKYCSRNGNCVEMLIAKVLVGKCGKGEVGLRRPPRGFDSVGDLKDIIVVFDRMQSYPEYVITLRI